LQLSLFGSSASNKVYHCFSSKAAAAVTRC
jgi:hypothetical protein